MQTTCGCTNILTYITYLKKESNCIMAKNDFKSKTIKTMTSLIMCNLLM